MIRIGIGTANWNSPYGLTNPIGLSKTEISEILFKMVENNIFDLDTAVNYFESREFLKEFLRNKSFCLTTKIPHSWTLDAGKLENRIKIELDSLGLNSFESVLLHEPVLSLKENSKDLNEALGSLLSNNLTKRVGISVYTPEDVVYCTKQSDLISEIQFPINPINQSFRYFFAKSNEYKNFVLVARSIFMQGLLTMQMQDYPIFFRNSTESNNWLSFLQKKGHSGFELCLIFLANLKFVDKAIFGINSVTELLEIIAFLQNATKLKSYVNGEFDFLASVNTNIYDPRYWNNE